MLRVGTGLVSTFLVGILLHAPQGLAQERKGAPKQVDNSCQGCCTQQTYCFVPYVTVLGGGGFARTDFKVNPGFDVLSVGPYGEVGIGARIVSAGSRFGFGVRASGIFGGLDGSTFYAPSGLAYNVEANAGVIFEAEFMVFGQSRARRNILDEPGIFFLDVGVGVGAHYQIFSINPAGAGTSEVTRTGFTTSIRIEKSIGEIFAEVEQSFLRDAKATAQLRYSWFGDTTVFVPGAVKVQPDAFYLGFGLTVPLITPPPRQGPDYQVM